MVAILIGYGLALTAAYMATHYERFRSGDGLGGGVALVLACYCLWDAAGKLYLGLAGRGEAGGSAALGGAGFCAGAIRPAGFRGLILMALPLIFLAALAIYRTRAPLLMTLGLFALMPVCSGLSHWFHSEQRKHWFGYWFGHDMFTPPFKGPDGKLIYDAALREQAMKGTNASMIYPEMAPDTVLYGGTDPGRFCPTYMIYCESFIPAVLPAGAGPEFQPAGRVFDHAERGGGPDLPGLHPRAVPTGARSMTRRFSKCCCRPSFPNTFTSRPRS